MVLSGESSSHELTIQEIMTKLNNQVTHLGDSTIVDDLRKKYPTLTPTELYLLQEYGALLRSHTVSMGQVRDLSQKIAKQSEQLLSLGEDDNRIDPLDRDELTGLPNYNQLIRDLLQDKQRSLVLFHINDMFRINDAFSRSTGDIVIKKIGKMLRLYAEEYDLGKVSTYRFDGTTFAIIFHSEIDHEHILNEAQRVESIKISVGENAIPISFSIGVTMNAYNVHSMISCAEKALKQSRRSKSIEFFDEERELITESEELFRMRNLINQAFEKDLFEIHLQEIRENATCIRPIGIKKFECLVRMYDSEEKTNLISPIKFLSVVKKDGKNIDLTTVVIEKACAIMAQNNFHYCINLTEEDLGMEGRAQLIYGQLQAHNIDPARVTFEILEDVEEVDLSLIQRNIIQLRSYGFGISIDDFGTGRSNFFRLTQIDVTGIKIDMRYVRGINDFTKEEVKKNKSLIKAIIDYAHSNNLIVVAEGVETQEEQLVLLTLGIDYSQGYLFSRPSPYNPNTIYNENQ